jgi:hypothetical protein
MTLLQLSTITGAKARDQANRVYPIAIAVADGIVTKLYKVIETLRADLHSRRWWWSR